MRLPFLRLRSVVTTAKDHRREAPPAIAKIQASSVVVPHRPHLHERVPGFEAVRSPAGPTNLQRVIEESEQVRPANACLRENLRELVRIDHGRNPDDLSTFPPAAFKQNAIGGAPHDSETELLERASAFDPGNALRSRLGSSFRHRALDKSKGRARAFPRDSIRAPMRSERSWPKSYAHKLKRKRPPLGSGSHSLQLDSLARLLTMRAGGAISPSGHWILPPSKCLPRAPF